MSELGEMAPDTPHRTQPIGLIVRAFGLLRQLIIPLIIVIFTLSDKPLAQGLFGIGGVLLVGVLFGFAYLGWRRLTFTISPSDIRVESGVLSRTARSVPFERIQDVSLEQQFLPRLLGLVAVKFETGAGGADDLSLAYLSPEQGEQLRLLVRERREESAPAAATTGDGQGAASDVQRTDEEAIPLFEMGPRRLFTFGLFEFSLAVFAVLAGLFQYVDDFIDYDGFDFDILRNMAEERGGWLLELGVIGQILSALTGLAALAILGSFTGLIRTFTREWGFLLEKTERGFRRRRGLFTRTDVVMPVHRVQGIKIGTGLVRRLFGWRGLSFVSLAQDSGASNHAVAPFATLEEIDPIVKVAGFHLPAPEADWHRATKEFRNVSIGSDVLFFVLAAVIAGGVTTVFAPDWAWLAVSIPLALAVFDAVAGFFSWRFKRHALDGEQIAAVSGVLAPNMKIARRVKLHSVEISQGPIARAFGYATLHLGQAGGELSIRGVPIERARQVRELVLETIVATDFSRLETA